MPTPLPLDQLAGAWSKDEALLLAAFCRALNVAPPPGHPLHPPVAAVQTDPLPTVASWDELIAGFEALVPGGVARRDGVVFTPEQIAAFMAEQTVARSPHPARLTVVDPAVGAGILLVAAMRALHAQTGEPPSQIGARLTGIDISEDSLRRCYLALNLAALALGDTNPVRPRLFCASALHPDTWRAAGRHDIAIANPPYVRFQHMADEMRADLAATFRVCEGGNYNLYLPFFEVARMLTRDGGQLALITPNGYLSAKSAEAARRWLLDTDTVDTIVNFGHHKVFDAGAYTAILLGSHRPPGESRQSGAIGYVPVPGLPGLAGLPDGWETTCATHYRKDQLSGRPWGMTMTSQRAAVDVIAATGTPLGQLADVRVGLATLRDKLYLIPAQQPEDGYRKIGTGHKVEDALTRLCVKVPEYAEGQPGNPLSARRILYPYVTSGDTVTAIDEETLASDYPCAYAYLTSVKDELARRDKGRKQYEKWYAYGRTQGLKPLGEKLLTPLYSGQPRFMLDPNPDTLFINGNAVVVREQTGTLFDVDVDLRVLQQVLNSAIAWLWVEAKSVALDGGYYSYSKSALGGLGVPELDEDQKEYLLSETDQAAKDEFLADVYGVNLPASYRREPNRENR